MFVLKKVNIIIELLLLQMIFLPALFAQTWTQRASAPTARWNPASVVLDGKIYVIGGQDSIPPYSSVDILEVYDQSTDVWETKSPMITDRWGLMVEVVNGKIYAIGGQTGSFSGGYVSSNVVEEYDPTLDTWISKTPMPTARGWGGSIVFYDTIFVFGGYTRPGYQTQSVIEKYHPENDSWNSEPPMPSPRRTFMTARVDDSAYLIGGWGSTLVQEYDLITRTWDTKTPMITARGGGGIGVVASQIYVVGGRGGNSDEFECYDPANDSWTSLVPMPTPREGLTAGVVDNKLYAIAGSVPVGQGGLPYYDINEEADGLTAVAENCIIKSVRFHLFQNHPNPFTTTTTITLSLPRASEHQPTRIPDAELGIYDVSGRLVRSIPLTTDHSALGIVVSWDGKDNSRTQMPTGIYFLQLNTEGFSETKKCLLLR